MTCGQEAPWPLGPEHRSLLAGCVHLPFLDCLTWGIQGKLRKGKLDLDSASPRQWCTCFVRLSEEGWGGSQDGGPLLQAQLALPLRFQSGDHYGGLRKSAFTPPHSAQHLGGWEPPRRGQMRMSQRMLKFKKAHEFGGITDESFN